MSAEIITLSLAEQREQDRKRYPDPAFNRWLDEGISDCGHTVWDAIGDTNAAWHGWENRQYYAPPPELERLREAAQMALEALVYHREQTRPIHSTDEAIDALRDALGEER